MKWVTVAACPALIIFAGVKIIPANTFQKTSELPKLTVSQNIADGMGFEGHMAYDISELVNANPWNEEMVLTHLPVYENTLDYTDLGISIVSEEDYEAMRAVLLRAAKNMGVCTLFHRVKEYAPHGTSKSEYLYIETDDMRIAVDVMLTVTVDFNPKIKLPDRYHFTSYSTWEEISEAANYLKKEYKDIIGFDRPQMNINDGAYDIDRQQRYSLEFYEKGDSDFEQVINYNFNRAVMYPSESSELLMIRIFEPNLTKKVGDYPIITSKEALDLLLEDKYITTVPYEIQGKEYVSKVELIYRTWQYEEYFMPYSRFYVELPEETEEDGLKTYGAYYVPAVKGEYLCGMETWDGNFQ